LKIKPYIGDIPSQILNQNIYPPMLCTLRLGQVKKSVGDALKVSITIYRVKD
jgi:hypothetical protein